MPNSPKSKADVEDAKRRAYRAWTWRILWVAIILGWGSLIYLAVST